MEVLLQHQADVNARDKYWRTPFHVAAASNSLGCAAALLPRLPNINITDRAGRSGLHHAAYCGHREMVELLVDRSWYGRLGVAILVTPGGHHITSN